MRKYKRNSALAVIGRRAALGVVGALVLAVAAAAFLVNGFFWKERVCLEDHYPVKLIGSASGNMCVPNGQEPPEGYVRYPAGKVPEYRFDEWEKRWENTVFDKDGNIVSG